MGMTRTKTGQVADEAALLTVIASEATAAGWTVWGPAGTVPANSYWFRSLGENGHLNIAGGLEPDYVNLCVLGLVAADIDTRGLVSPSVGGYVNNDSTGPGTPQQAKTDTGAYRMSFRNPGTPYTYRIAVDLDAIRVLIGYESAAFLSAQAVFYIGTFDPTSDDLEVQATARVAAVAPGVIGPGLVPPIPSVQITLDGDITNGLKDTGAAPAPAFPNDPAQQRLFFQVVDDGTMPVGDAFQVERALAIVPSSLTTVGGLTQIEVPLVTTPGQSKLFQQGSGQRYDALRGVGDLVRLCAQPTMTIVCGSAAAGRFPDRGRQQAILSWDVFGGQRGAAAPIEPDLVNYNTRLESVLDPDTITLRYSYWRIYAQLAELAVVETESSIIPQDAEGVKLYGAPVGLIFVCNIGQPDLSLYQINGDLNQRYCSLENISGAGLGPPPNMQTAGMCWAVGPGF